MNKRVNVLLPEETIRVLDSVAPKGNRSRVISDAVLYYVSRRGKSKLAEQLKAGAIANRERDLEIAQEWFTVDEQTWQRSGNPNKVKR
ncbi:MAG: hypothetical protein IT168_08690 [Bryobacterales bacterium]|nr:hypothetical protein [Bryobacterales bacterium]